MSNRVIPAGSINPNATIAPGVVVIESLAPGAVTGIPTNLVGAVGIATWGPVDAPVSISTPSDYASTFGNVTTELYDLGTFINAAYLQGVVGSYVCVRVTDGTDTASTGNIVDDQKPTPIPGVQLTALYTGLTGDTIKVQVTAGSIASSYSISIGRPGYVAESFTNIDASGSPTLFWADVVSAINNGQSGVRGPSELVRATLSTGIGQVDVATPGSGFNSAPTISLTGGGTGAAATAVVGYPIQSVAVGTPGSYATLPSLATTGPGTGAVLVPSMKAVSGTAVAPGSGYAPADTITLAGGTFSAAAILNVASTRLASVASNAIGTGYATGDTITLGGGTASTQAVVTLTATKLASTVLNAPGSGYAPSDTITLAGGTAATKAILTISTTKLVSAAINAGGSGYAPGDTVTLAGGTAATKAIVTVGTVDGGGAILTFSITTAGSYTANASTFTQFATSGGGSGATFQTASYGVNTFTISTPGSYTVNTSAFTQFSTSGAGSGATFQSGSFGVNTFSISSPGVYTVNTSTFTQAATSGSGSGATFQTASYGVNTVTVNTPGSYTALPASPVSQSSSSGTGTGATFTAFWGLLSVAVSSPGNGYTPASIFAVSGGGGSGATGTLTLASTGGILSSIGITASGIGYTAPTVVITGGGGTGATATALVGSQSVPGLTSGIQNVSLTGGTNGNTGVTGITELGTDGQNPTGMYALRNSNISLFALVDNSDSTTFPDQYQFGAVTGSQAILVGPLSQTLDSAVTLKKDLGLLENYSVFLLGDWCYFLDTNNNGIVRLISPQGFYGGKMSNLAPEQSPLNKQIFGIIATQKTKEKKQYSDAEIVKAMQNGIEIISNPIPAGGVFGCETGKSSGYDLTTNNVNIQRMANFISLSMSNSGVLGSYIGQLQTPSVRVSARSALYTFLSNLQANQQIAAFKVVLDETNNPNPRVVLGFMEAQVTVQLFSVIVVFLIDLNVGTVTIQS